MNKIQTQDLGIPELSQLLTDQLPLRMPRPTIRPEADSPQTDSGFFRKFFNHLDRLWNVYILERLILRQKIHQFYMMFGGHIFFQTVSAAVQLDLFSRLAGGVKMTAEEIRQAVGLEEQPCRILLLGLASLGLLKKRGAAYKNSWVAEVYLTSQSPKNIIHIVRWQHFINYPAMFHFHDALMANRNVGLEELPGRESTLYGRLTHDPRRERIFQDAMEQISRQATSILANVLDLRSVRYLVDVGGGNGTNILHLAQRQPDLRAAVFDSPTVCAIARANIEAHGLSDRLYAVAGDCFKDPFPRGADAILFCHFFTIWSKEKNLELLKKAYAALPQGGRVMIFNMMQNDRGTGPMSAAMGSPYFLTLATGEGMLYSWSEYEELFQQAGFKNIRRLRLPKDHGIITGFK